MATPALDEFRRGSSLTWATGVQLGMVVRHFSCHEVDDGAESPVMHLERTQGDVVVFNCPACFHKITLDVQFAEPGQ